MIALYMIIGILFTTVFLLRFSPTFGNWLKEFPMPDGTVTGNFMPGILVWFFMCLVIADFMLFIAWILKWNF